MNEYIIWGIPNGETEETILLTKFMDKLITDKETANSLGKILIKKYGVTKLRIHEFSLNEKPDFTKTLNI